MKKINVSEAESLVLNWLVAKCEDQIWTGEWYEAPRDGTYRFKLGTGAVCLLCGTPYTPSTDPAQAYPIIYREGISVTPKSAQSGNDPWRLIGWQAQNLQKYSVFSEEDKDWFNGPTPLIAAMRCYVASKLGDVVEVPEELI